MRPSYQKGRKPENEIVAFRIIEQMNLDWSGKNIRRYQGSNLGFGKSHFRIPSDNHYTIAPLPKLFISIMCYIFVNTRKGLTMRDQSDDYEPVAHTHCPQFARPK